MLQDGVPLQTYT